MNLIKFPIFRASIAVLFVALLAACAVDTPEVVVEPETLEEGTALPPETAQDEPMVTGGVMDAGDVLITATSLMDYSFENIDGEVGGEIEDIIVDLASGDVLYVTVEYGGFLDIGDTELPMPLNAFIWGPDGQLLLNFDEQQLENFPDLGTDWLNPADPAWDDQVGGFWRDIDIDPGFDYAEASFGVATAADVINLGIADVGLGTGTLADMLIDLGESQIEYMLLAYDPTAFGDELVAVPIEAFDISTIGDQFAFRPGIDTTILQGAPTFTRDALVVGDVATFADVDTYWSTVDLDADTGVIEEETVVDTEVDTTVITAVGVADATQDLIRASTLLDYNVSNQLGDVIGEIEDMLIDVDTGQILYATLEYGGFLDIGDRHVPVPLSALSWLGVNELALNFDEQQLEALPDLDTEWPNVADPSWNDPINAFWVDVGIDPGFAASDSQTVMWASNLLDYDFASIGVEADAAISDLLIDLSQSKAQHVIVDYGGFFDDQLIPLPFSAIDVSVVGDAFQFDSNVDAETLQTAPRLDRTTFTGAEVFDPTVDDEIVIFWEDAGYTYE